MLIISLNLQSITAALQYGMNSVFSNLLCQMDKKFFLILISYRSECCREFFKIGKNDMDSQKAYILTYHFILISKMSYSDKFIGNYVLYINVAFY